MTAAAGTVLVLTPSAPPAAGQALAEVLAALGPVRTPEWPLGRHDDLLGAPVETTLAALAEAPGPAVVCGLAAGVLVALHVAAAEPERVAGLVLCTGARPLGTVVRSVHRGVASLLPLGTLQRMGGRGAALVPLLDPVRPQDYRRVAPQVAVPALVPYGARDRVNRAPSKLLARTLPAGSVLELEGAGPGWVWREPERLVEPVRRLTERR